MPIGDDNTFVFVDPPDDVGSGNTFIGATDGRVNTILNRGGLAIGADAYADETSVAIGARANAGGRQAEALKLLGQLQALLLQAGDDNAADAVVDLGEEVQKPDRSDGRARQLWAVVKVAATTNEAVVLVGRIGALLALGPHH